MAQGIQVKNGKAFEYALAKTYADYLQSIGVNAVLSENQALAVAERFFNGMSANVQSGFLAAALKTVETMVKLEPGFTAQSDNNDILQITLNADANGEDGDVRDVVFRRNRPVWEIGFSAKNNNDAVKHSRLSSILDFGKSWVGVPCSQDYWNDIKPVFQYIDSMMKTYKYWKEIGSEKAEKIYSPLLQAFKRELLKINAENAGIPKKLIQYLVGQYPFYKIIKDDAHNLVIVKAFNLDGELNKTVNGVKSRYRTPRINFPTRIVEFEMKPDSDNTLNMIMDNGWEISFRIHNADAKFEKSLKFDIKLLGNPPVLFTQHLFQAE